MKRCPSVLKAGDLHLLLLQIFTEVLLRTGHRSKQPKFILLASKSLSLFGGKGVTDPLGKQSCDSPPQNHAQICTHPPPHPIQLQGLSTLQPSRGLLDVRLRAKLQSLCCLAMKQNGGFSAGGVGGGGRVMTQLVMVRALASARPGGPWSGYTPSHRLHLSL